MRAMRAMAVAGLLICGRSFQGGSILWSMPDDATEAGNVEKAYREAVRVWEEYIQDPRIAESSRTSDYTNNEPYRRIVALGTAALPFLMRDLENGKFLLNEAAHRLTGIEVQKLYPAENVVGEQDIAKLWVRWWKEHGQARL